MKQQGEVNTAVSHLLEFEIEKEPFRKSQIRMYCLINILKKIFLEFT